MQKTTRETTLWSGQALSGQIYQWGEVLKNMNAVTEAIQCVVEKREKATPLHPRQRGTVAAFLLDLLKDLV